MKTKYLKRTAVSAAVLMLFLTLIFPVSAYASPVILGLSTQDISVGDSFSVYVSGSAASNLSLHYDGTMVKLTGQAGASLDGNTLTIKAKSVSFTFEAIKDGSAGFVASSDAYDRSSVIVNIKAASDGTTEVKDDNTDAGTDETVSSSSDESTSESVSTSSEAVSTSDIYADTTDSEPEDRQDDASISSSDLSFKDLITDRRMILVIAVLVAIIIILIIRLATMHFNTDSGYESDDIDFDDAEARIKEKEDKEAEEEAVKEKPVKDEPVSKAKELAPEIDEEKLTMPKAPKKPAEKLKIDDLNDL